jgi:C4-dicarboxylate-specific signal transduction histidine kinase
MIEESIELCKEKIRFNSIDLQVDCPIGLKIDCRSGQISQVILNLIGNSIDAIENNADKWIKIQVSNVAEQVQICVTDSGLGISAEIATKMLQPFFTTKEVDHFVFLNISLFYTF